MNPLLDSIFKHKSIRKYKNQPLEKEKLELIIKAAQAAPNWCNGQQVSIIAVKDKSAKEKLEKLCFDQKYISTCSVFLVFCIDFYRIKLAFEKSGKSNENFEKYITQLDTIIVGSHDVGIALGNTVVAADALGLGTVPIGLIRHKAIEITKELNLPKYVVPLIGLCVGYPDDDPGLKPRLPMKAVCFDEKYDVNKAKEGIDEYDEIYKKYLSGRGSNSRDSNWSQSISDTYVSLTGGIDEDYALFKQQGFISIDKK
jgi:FMN reductase [NAD(P)H]